MVLVGRFSGMYDLLDFYDNYDEDSRLHKDNGHKLEWLTTVKYFKELIPKGSKILDCCAGTGQYSFWLGENGFEVTAGDVVPKHVEIMKASYMSKNLSDIYCGNVLEMPQFTDGQFDVVLCMGAYYHLHDTSERNRAIKECIRVLKSNGLFVLSYINRNAVFINQFKSDPSSIAKQFQIIIDGKNDVFYASDFNEIEEMASRQKLETIANIATDGMMYPLIDCINSLSEQQFKQYLNYHFKVCEVPSILGNSMHGLYFGRKVSML